MRILNITNIIRVLVVLAAFSCLGCIDVSSNTAPSSQTTCTTNADGTQTCTSQPTGGSHWHFWL
jgi:hypothetical protein